MRCKAHGIYCLALVFAIWKGSRVLAADVGKAAEPLGELQHLASLPSHWLVQCEISGTAQWAFVKGESHSRSFRMTCTCVRDGDRFDVQTVRFEAGKPVRAWRSIIDGCYISYEVPPLGKRALSGMYAAEGSHFIGAALPSGWGGFEGYAAGDYLSLNEIIQKAQQVEVGQESIDGCECMHLKAPVSGHGLYEAWLDPAMNYLPRKLAVEKNPHDLLGGLLLSQWTHLAPAGSRGTVSLTKVTHTMDQTRFERVGSRWFPMSCRVTRVQSFADGNAETTIMECRRTRLVLDPDYLALRAFQPELRQAARLANLVDPQLPYQWEDGKAVPLVDVSLVAQMDRTADELKRELGHSGTGEK